MGLLERVLAWMRFQSWRAQSLGAGCSVIQLVGPEFVEEETQDFNLNAAVIWACARVTAVPERRAIGQRVAYGLGGQSEG